MELTIIEPNSQLSFDVCWTKVEACHGFYIYILYDYWTQAGSEIYGVVGDILKFSAKIVFLVNSKA